MQAKGMPPGRPLVLLSNDDGHAAPGLRALRDALNEHADVIVCAPEANQSATSHSLSLHRILRLRRVEKDVFAIDGTPADCVYVALHSGTRVLPRRPDMVVSGMNHGLNLGVDVFYSGTVAAAREAALRGIPAMAVSADVEAQGEPAAALGARLAIALLDAFFRALEELGQSEARPAGGVEAWAGRVPLFNVNIPGGSRWALRATRLGARLYEEDVIYRKDPRGREYLWIGGAGVRHTPVPGSDTEAHDEGIASVTPLSLDLSAHDFSGLASEVVKIVF
jgi:5'-nucleotidase